MNAFTLPLTAALDPGVAGMKASTLAVLRRAGLTVPDGFVLAAAAHAEYLSALPDGGSAVGGDLDEDAYLQVLRQAEWPAGVRRELLEAHRVLAGGAAPVAVRSSSTVEDGAAHSYAGQFTSLLDVRGPDAVQDAVLRCWTGTRSHRVRRYHGGVAGAEMAVLVQHMVPARWSGVLFSTDPVRPAAGDRLLLEVVRGLPAQLCDGRVDPFRYEVDRSTLATVAGDAGVPSGLIRDVCLAALAAEEVLGRPVDMEWAAADGTVQVLQARPITPTAAPPPPTLVDLLMELD